MKIIVISVIALSLFAADPPQVDADKLAIIQAQRDQAIAVVHQLQAAEENRLATEAITKAMEARATHLQCKLDPQTLECKPEPK